MGAPRPRGGRVVRIVDDAQWRSLCAVCGLVVDERDTVTTPLDVERYVIGLQDALGRSLDQVVDEPTTAVHTKDPA